MRGGRGRIDGFAGVSLFLDDVDKDTSNQETEEHDGKAAIHRVMGGVVWIGWKFSAMRGVYF